MKKFKVKLKELHNIPNAIDIINSEGRYEEKLNNEIGYIYIDDRASKFFGKIDVMEEWKFSKDCFVNRHEFQFKKSWCESWEEIKEEPPKEIFSNESKQFIEYLHSLRENAYRFNETYLIDSIAAKFKELYNV